MIKKLLKMVCGAAVGIVSIPLIEDLVDKKFKKGQKDAQEYWKLPISDLIVDIFNFEKLAAEFKAKNDVEWVYFDSKQREIERILNARLGA